MADGRWLQSRPDTVLAVTLVEGVGTGGEGRNCEKVVIPEFEVVSKEYL